MARSSVELRVARVEPGPDFVRAVMLPEPRHDPGEVRNEELRLRVRRLACGLPAETVGQRNAGEIRDVGVLEATGLAQAIDEPRERRRCVRLQGCTWSFVRPASARRRAWRQFVCSPACASSGRRCPSRGLPARAPMFADRPAQPLSRRDSVPRSQWRRAPPSSVTFPADLFHALADQLAQMRRVAHGAHAITVSRLHHPCSPCNQW